MWSGASSAGKNWEYLYLDDPAGWFVELEGQRWTLLGTTLVALDHWPGCTWLSCSFYFSWQESTSTIPNRCKDLIRTSISIPASSPQCGFFGIKFIPSYQVSFQRMGKDHNIVMLGVELLGFKRKMCAPTVQCCQNTGGSGILICRKAELCVCISKC